MPFSFRPHGEIPDVIVVQPRSFGDGRGWFEETFKRSEFERAGIKADFRQDNHSRSTVKGVIRGLHYQKKPAAQGKLVRCCVGAIFDVAVDIRRGSPTYGKWIGMELTAENRTMLWIPEGFAHAVCTLTDIAEVLYKATGEYSPQEDRAIRWSDPALGISWPVSEPVLSAKDAVAPTLDEADNNFNWEG